MACRSLILTRAGCALICMAYAMVGVPRTIGVASSARSATKISRSAQKTARRSSGRPGRVQLGIDVLESEKFAPLRGKRIGLITNHTGQDALGRSTVDQLSHAPGVQLVALFSPEHGLAGRKDEENLASGKDAATGLPVYSLYGDTRRPTDEMLANIDALVFDVQDAGVRFYTYTTTMAYCMEEAAKRRLLTVERDEKSGGYLVHSNTDAS